MAEKKQSKVSAAYSKKRATVADGSPNEMEFKPEVHASLAVINEYIDKVLSEKGEACFSIEEAGKVKNAAKTIVNSIAKTDIDGNYMNAIDGEIVNTVMANREFIVEEITSLMKGEKPSPLDYYNIYCKVLDDSGLLSKSTIDPLLLRELVNSTGGYAEDFSLVAANRDPCKACGLCTGCTLCAACTACLITGIWGVVGTGVVGATSGTIGNLLSSATNLATTNFSK
jgi:hypothetical protein